MRERLRRFALLSKSLVFTIAIHAALVALLFVGFHWAPAKRGGDDASSEPIAAVAIDESEVRALVEKKRQAEERKRQQAERAAAELAELQRKQKEAEAQLRKTEEQRAQREAEERAAQARRKEREAEAEAKRKREEEARKKREAEEKKKREEEEKRKAAEEKRKKEALQRKLEAEEKKKREAEAKRKAAEEKRRREAEAQRKEEQRKADQAARRVRIKTDAANALSALVDRIAAAVEDNWRRPPASRAGLVVVIRVKVARDGRVLSATVTRGSGDSLFDQSAERAVRKASPLPFPDNPEYYEHINEFDFKFSPDRR